IYSAIFAGAVISIDGAMGDWAGYPVIDDSPGDMTANPNINMVGYTALITERELFIYIQVTPSGNPFSGPAGSTGGAESFRVLIDRDGRFETGYCGYGVGAEYMVEVMGSGGQILKAALMSYPTNLGGSCDARADPTRYQSVGAVTAAAGSHALEIAVHLSDMGASSSGRPPFLLAIAQDSAGNVDVGDTQFSNTQGTLAIVQAIPSAGGGAIPTGGEVLLLSMVAQAYFVNITLFSFNVYVESSTGNGCIQITRVLVAGNQSNVGGGACDGLTAQIQLGPLQQEFNSRGTSGRKTIDVYGRASGTSGADTVRVYLRGPADVSLAGERSATVIAGVVPPLSWTNFYVGSIPPTVRIDGAFSDWNAVPGPLDADPGGDNHRPGAGATPGGPNAGALLDRSVDIRASRADVNTAAQLASFYLQVEGSIMESLPLAWPSAPRPSQISTGGGGGAARTNNVATIFVDTDSNRLTGWQRFEGMGVDAIITVEGQGGGGGRAPVLRDTRVEVWNNATKSFAAAGGGLQVGFDSSKLETQVTFGQLCNGPCGRARYVFQMSGTSGQSDQTLVRDAGYRGGGDYLAYDEAYGLTRTAFLGDRYVPMLSVAVSAPSSNKQDAVLYGMAFEVDGLGAQLVITVRLHEDLSRDGRFDAEELGALPVAEGFLDAQGRIDLTAASSIVLTPGTTFMGIVTVDLSTEAPVPAWLNMSMVEHAGLLSSGVTDVRYYRPLEGAPMRVMPYMPPGNRGSADLVLNEMQFVSDWVEIYDPVGQSSIGLTNPQIYLVMYHIDFSTPPFFFVDANVSYSGSTDSDGFAIATVSALTYSPSSFTYQLQLRCDNCTGNGSHMDLDSAPVPRSNQVNRGAWGRYPDATGSWQSTDNNTSSDFNTIPEFQDFVMPILAVSLVVMVARRRRIAPDGAAQSTGPP
ncbi:MAG TPA: hypothetical protein VGB42_10010, partial [Candidatus Thermoplasmatota archaeon]